MRDQRYADLAIKLGTTPVGLFVGSHFPSYRPYGRDTLLASQSFSPSSNGKIDLTGYRVGSHF
jgi:hypothetical protein